MNELLATETDHESVALSIFSFPFLGGCSRTSSGELAIAVDVKEAARLPPLIAPGGDKWCGRCAPRVGEFGKEGNLVGGDAPSPAAASVSRNSTQSFENDW